MDIGKVFTDGVIIRERHRPLDEGKVEHLAESLRELGLQQPISIWVEGEGAPVLVAGRHRLEAARKLGWEQIDCIFVGLDETEREMWEIAENLHRSELTALERSAHVARYAELVEAKAAQVEHPDDRYAKRGDSESSRQLNLSRGDIQRSKKVAGLSEEAKAEAQRLGLDDNQSALLNAAKADEPEQQIAALRAKAASRAISNARVKQADHRSLQEEAEEKVAALLAEHIPGEHWDALKANLHTAKCDRLAREFGRVIGVSVFDNTQSGRAA